MVVAFILMFVLLTATTFKDIGLIFPNQNLSENLGMIVGFLVGVLVLVFVLMKIPFYRKYQNSQIGEIDYMLPTTKLERKWAVLAAITAGVCEEIIYRGFVIEYLSKLPFGIQPVYILLISAVVFGFAHIYQGWKGFLLTGIVGYAMARVYLSTGSLLFPILLHIIIDLRAFLFTKKLAEETQTTVKL